MGQAWFRQINRKLGIILFITLILVAAQANVRHSSAQDSSLEIDFSRVLEVPEEFRLPIREALENNLSLLPAQTRFTVSELRVEGDWAHIVAVPTYIVEAGWEIEYDQAEVIEMLGQRETAGTWHVTLYGESSFEKLTARIPAGFIDFSAPSVSPAEAYLFPWTAGQRWYKTQGWHSGNAIDFQPVVRSDPSVHFAVLAPASGTVTRTCNDGYQSILQIVHADGTSRYVHMASNSVQTQWLGQSVCRGCYLGLLYNGTQGGGPCPAGTCQYNTACGYGTAVHLHFVLPSQNMTIDGNNANTVANSAFASQWTSSNQRTSNCGCTDPGVPTILEPDPGDEVSSPFSVELQPGAHNPCTGTSDYQIQIDNNSDFSSPEYDNAALYGYWSTSTTISNITLPGLGVYYVRARQGDTVNRASGFSGSVWFYYNGPDPDRPTQVILKTPRHDSPTADTTPRLSWSKAKNAVRYYLQVDDQPDFSSPIISDSQITGTSFTVPPESTLLYNRYFWRVIAYNANGETSTGGWSPVRSFWVTLLQSPKNGDFTQDTTPVFKWKKLSGATQYEFQFDNDIDFSSTLYTQNVSGTSFTVPNALGLGRYYWRIRAQRADSSWTDVMPTWAITVTQALPGKPTLVSPVNKWTATSSTVTFTWNAATNGVTYQFQIGGIRDFTRLQQDTVVSGLSNTVTSLEWTSVYYWRVRALNAEGVAGPWSSVWTIQIEGPAAPAQVSPGDKAVTNDTTPMLTWNSVDGVAGYQVHLAYDKDFYYRIADVHVGGLSWEAPTLKDGTYYWRVRGYYASAFHGTWSKTWRVTIDTVGPKAPKMRTPKKDTSTTDPRPVFTWGVVSGAVQYHLQIDDYWGFDSLAFDRSDITGGRYDLVEPDPALAPNNWYYWRVRARDKAGNWGPWSNIFAVSTSILQSPKHSATTADSTPTFRWKRVSDAASYTLQVCTDWACTNPVFTSPAVPKTSFTLTSPLNPGNYLWRVQVVTTGGGSYWSGTFSVYITPALPKRIKPLSPANRAMTNDNSVTFRWPPQEGITRYWIQVDDDKGFNSLNVSVGLDSNSSPVTYVSSMANPLPDGTYYWRVTGINSQGAGGPWSQRRMLTIDTTPPLTPTLIGPAHGTRQTNTKLKLEWFKSDGAARYEVQLDTDPAFPRPPFDVGRKTSYKPTTPLMQNTWYWRVRAVDKAGNTSAWSGTQTLYIVAGNTTVDTPVPADFPPTSAPPVLVPVEPTQPPPPHKPVDPTPTPVPPADHKVPPPSGDAPTTTRQR